MNTVRPCHEAVKVASDFGDIQPQFRQGERFLRHRNCVGTPDSLEVPRTSILNLLRPNFPLWYFI